MILPALKKIYYRYINNLDVLESNKMTSIGDTCGIVVNYKTPDLIRNFLSDFRYYYPDLHLLIVDNSSFDRSTDLIYSVCKKDGNMMMLANFFNFHHGPGLHKAIQYIENYFEFALIMDSDLQFHKTTFPTITIDGESPPFGPVGDIKSAKFSGGRAEKSIERAYYDHDLMAQDAVLTLYNSGIEISKIQKCFSVGMFGKERRLVPTKWSITATDDIISKSLVSEVLEFDLIDSCRVFSHDHLGNMFSVILFPHRWIFEMQEAWHDGNSIGFGSDSEDARGIDHPPAIAGAYFAAKLGVTEYLAEKKIQAAVLVLREIRPEYAVPVGVWQIREAIRAAMKKEPYIAESFDDGANFASKRMSVSKSEWLSKGRLLKMLKQKSISDFF